MPLLAHVADGVDLLFRKDGILLRCTGSDDGQRVLINRVRTLQALSSVLMIAHEISSAKDTVEVITSSTSNAIQVEVKNLSSQVKVLNAEARLGMALAEANVWSQQGKLSWTPQPFRVQIEFQKAPSASLS
jgi:hypothetical protein